MHKKTDGLSRVAGSGRPCQVSLRGGENLNPKDHCDAGKYLHVIAYLQIS